MNIKNQISFTSKLLLSLSSLILIASCFLPIWIIQLLAPQYPDGLNLYIYSYKLGGDIDIVNGLNHYIGMKPVYEKDFIEFIVLPYIIAFFALATNMVALFSIKKGLYILFFGFLFFGIIAMFDFWYWGYYYGHHLNPDAAIVVPGMSYRPPLIGYKKLLNFGVYSIPAIGGWLFVTSGLLIFIAVMIELVLSKKIKKSKLVSKAKIISISSFFVLILLDSCGNYKPEAIKLNVDNCEFCKMTISDNRFSAELITTKGRVYKFDDISCLLNYSKNTKYHSLYVSNYLPPHILIPLETAIFLKGGEINSPMGGNIACFSIKDSADIYLKILSATKTDWPQLSK